MRAVIVGRNSKLLHPKPARCRLCPRDVQAGESVLFMTLPTVGYVENRWVAHVECMMNVVERAPEGLPVRGAKAELCRIRRRAIRLRDTIAAAG